MLGVFSIHACVCVIICANVVMQPSLNIYCFCFDEESSDDELPIEDVMPDQSESEVSEIILFTLICRND